ncbi:MAG: DNA-binding transcriptional regulator OxyR [Bacteroidetes bacterium HGW-Bacteroidetes-1]|jgi:LysR family hydrogen peroxide-inducible transcriptional activator|nr:MAG: DNA-binding transcriptional regulator OxyR [Bacteroidetes bacterium HGW-Bacteroidetes-1]
MITLIQLEYIVAIDTFRHFAKAAEHCFVTQPTLSMQVKKLEDNLGIRVFDRTRQPVVPTDIGMQVIAQARKILAESGKLGELVKIHSGDVSGDLKIGIIPTLGPYLLPLFAGNFKKKYPLVNLYVEELVTEQIAEKLKNDLLDAGIFATPFDNEGVIVQPLFYEEMIIFAHSEHPLLNKQKIQVKDMVSPDIWLLSDGHCFRNQVINLCAIKPESKQELPFELKGGSLETLMRIIRREGGFTIIPELTANELRGADTENLAHFDETKPLREISICYSRNFVKHTLIQHLAEEIKISVPPPMLDRNRGELVTWR